VREEPSFGKTTWKLIDRLFFLFILLPLSLPGFIVNLPVMVVGKAANYLTPYQESKATLKLLICLLVAPAVYAVVGFGLSWLLQAKYWLVMLILIILGVVLFQFMI
jgi:hypothetical protein